MGKDPSLKENRAKTNQMLDASLDQTCMAANVEIGILLLLPGASCEKNGIEKITARSRALISAPEGLVNSIPATPREGDMQEQARDGLV